jgi:hypothetical protein
MAKQTTSKETVKKEVLTVPSTAFEVEGQGKFKFTVAKFILSTPEGGKEIKAEDALKDAKILAYLVTEKAGVIELIEE